MTVTRRFTLFLTRALTLVLAGPVSAIELPDSIHELKPNSYALVNETAHRQLQAAVTAFDKGEYESAFTSLERIIEKYKHNPVIVSYATRAGSRLLAINGRYNDAIPLIETTLRLASLDKAPLNEQRYLLAQIYGQEEQFNNTVKHMNTWFKQANKEQYQAEHYSLLAFAQFQLKDYQSTVKTTQKGIKHLNQADESLLSLQFNAHIALKNYSNAAVTARKLVSVSPQNLTYWKNWVAALQLNGDTAHALNVMELNQQQLALSDREEINYIHLLLTENFPERAASRLEDALNNGRIEPNTKHVQLLSQAWERAGHTDKAILAISESDVTLSESLLKRLVYLHTSQSEWRNVIQLADGYQELFANTPWFALNLGRAYYESNRAHDALKVFERLHTQMDKKHTEYKAVEQWKKYLVSLDKPK